MQNIQKQIFYVWIFYWNSKWLPKCDFFVGTNLKTTNKMFKCVSLPTKLICRYMCKLFFQDFNAIQ